MSDPIQQEEENKSCPPSRWAILKQALNNLPPEAFIARLRETPQAILLDVRKPEERTNGTLPDAQIINYLDYDFWEDLKQMDRDRTYFVFCQSGRRSIRACTLMKNGGFKKVYNLDGGLNGMPKAYLLQ